MGSRALLLLDLDFSFLRKERKAQGEATGPGCGTRPAEAAPQAHSLPVPAARGRPPGAREEAGRGGGGAAEPGRDGSCGAGRAAGSARKPAGGLPQGGAHLLAVGHRHPLEDAQRGVAHRHPLLLPAPHARQRRAARSPLVPRPARHRRFRSNPPPLPSGRARQLAAASLAPPPAPRGAPIGGSAPEQLRRQPRGTGIGCGSAGPAPPGPAPHHLRTRSMAAITFLMSSLARLRVSARTERPDMAPAAPAAPAPQHPPPHPAHAQAPPRLRPARCVNA